MKLALSPRHKRYAVLGAVAAGLVGVAILAPGRHIQRHERPETARIDGVILSGDTRAASLEAVMARLDEMNRRYDALANQVEAHRQSRERELQASLRRLRSEIASADGSRRRDAQNEIAAIRREVESLGLGVALPSDAQLAREADAAAARAEGHPPPVVRLPQAEPPAADPIEDAPAAEPPVLPDDTRLRARPGRERRTAVAAPAEPLDPAPQHLSEAEIVALFHREADRLQPASLGTGPQASVGSGRGGTGLPRLIETTIAPPERRSTVGGASVRLPATTILSGVLLTGLDAPSGAAAQINPVPVLMRLKHEAILPNNFSADVRECFVLLAAYGDLSSERANMRAEQLSCVLRDGTVMQQPVRAFAAGEDGKAGLRGRVVTKQGAFIGRAITVGILDGVAQAFRRSVTVSVGSGASAGEAAVAGFGAGFSSSLDRIAEWYLEQASSLFPVIEIDNGRAIDVVLTEGLDFRIDL